MSEKITKKIIVFTGEVSLRAMKFDKVVEFVNEKYAEIPTESQGNSRWSMSTYTPGDVLLTIAYKRLETDEENTARDEAEAITNDANLKRRVEKAKLVAEEFSDILDVRPEFTDE